MDMKTSLGGIELSQLNNELIKLKEKGSEDEYRQKLKLIKEIRTDLLKIDIEVAKEVIPLIRKFEEEVLSQ